MVSGVFPDNDAGYDARLDFARKLMKDTFGRGILVIDPVDYQKNSPFPYNNYVYKIRVAPRNGPSDAHGSAQPGTSPIPEDLMSFILRLSASGRGYNDPVRVENEVASMSLARHAIKSSHIIPRVFSWANGDDGGRQGWMLEEHMPGKDLAGDLHDLDEEKQRTVLAQLADMLCQIQEYELPGTVDSFGGLAFSPSGGIVSGAMGKSPFGPGSSHRSLVLADVAHSLRYADENPRIQGWRPNGIRARLDKFISTALPGLIPDFSDMKKTFIHGDFSIENVLYDPATLQITGLIDFDFSFIGTASDEFNIGVGYLPSERDDPLRHALLHGFPVTDCPSEEVPEQMWKVAKMWDGLLEERGARKPSNIRGMEGMGTVGELDGLLCPMQLHFQYRMPTEERREEARALHEKRLREVLERHGY